MQSMFRPNKVNLSVCSVVILFKKFCRILLNKDPEADRRKKCEGLLRTKKDFVFFLRLQVNKRVEIEPRPTGENPV